MPAPPKSESQWSIWLVVAVAAVVVVVGLVLTSQQPPAPPPDIRPPLPVRPRTVTAPTRTSSELDLLPESVGSSSARTGGATDGQPLSSGTPTAISDLRAPRSFDLDAGFVAQIKKLLKAGIDPVLLAHAIARQLNRQSEALLMTGENVDYAAHQKQAEARSREWLIKLVGETASKQWLAESQGAAPPIAAATDLPADFVSRIGLLQSDGVDSALLAHVVLSQKSRQERALQNAGGGSFANQDVITSVLGADANNRWQTQETFRHMAGQLSPLNDDQLLAYSKLYQDYRATISDIMNQTGRDRSQTAAELQAVRERYTQAKQQLVGADLASRLP
jgi:hypothetical protein